MSQKKNILMICSWLNTETGVGSFFWEQAGFMTPAFNMNLCVFSNKYYGVRNFRKFFSHNIVTVDKAPNGLSILKFNYPQLAYASDKVNFNLFRSSLRKFQKYMAENNMAVDLVHAQSLLNAGIMAQYFYEETGIPYVFTEHDQFNFRYISEINKKMIDKIFLNDFDKLVVSHDKIRQLCSNKLFANYEVVGNTIDDKIFNYKEIQPDEDVFRIITIGAYAHFKDQETLLKAIQIIDQNLLGSENKKIEFIWLGINGWGKDTTIEVEKLLERFPFQHIKVTIVPKVERLKIRNYLQIADLFVTTSIAEGMPVSVMEALACGVPVCSTRCGGVDDLINDSNGRIYQIKDFIAIADFITDFYLGKYEFDNKKISEEFITKWGKEAFKNKLSNIYNRMIKKHSNN